MKRIRRSKRQIFFIGLIITAACLLAGTGWYNVYKPLPAGLSYAGPIRPVDEIAFYRDLTWVDAEGTRRTQQEIFDKVLQMISGARNFVVLDMFLFNDFIGNEQSPYRRLAQELTDALLARKRKYPEMQIIVVTDPINTVYNGLGNRYFARMKAENIQVVFTELEVLRDSNPAYSAFWRIFVKPFGNSPGSLLPNPFGKGRVSLRSYLAMLNFKANHRKLVICDAGGDYAALITSANPHDGSAAHGNTAIYLKGPAAFDLLLSEKAVPGFPEGCNLPPDPDADLQKKAQSEISVQIVSEGRIKEVLLSAIDFAGKGDKLDMIVFYLSDRDIVSALKRAFGRGAVLRILLDPNKDAFGRAKNGIPNRQVAAELVKSGIHVRWSNTHGEQSHTKMLMLEYKDGRSLFVLGSANFTRRNLEDLNLETDIAVRGPGVSPIFMDARNYTDLLWSNPDGRKFSVDYIEYADDSFFRRLMYRWMEATGMSTF